MPFAIRNLILPSLMVTGLALPLAAQDANHFGLQASVLRFEGEVKSGFTDRPGFDLGIHWGMPLQSGHEVQVRLDARSAPPTSASASGSLYGAALGVDYLYYLGQQRKGLFLKAGLEYYGWALMGQGYMVGSGGSSMKKYEGSGLQPLIGAGYRMNPMISFEFGIAYARMDCTESNYPFTSAKRKADACLIQFGISIH